MDEILASIRRIIADDGEPGTAMPAPEAGQEPATRDGEPADATDRPERTFALIDAVFADAPAPDGVQPVPGGIPADTAAGDAAPPGPRVEPRPVRPLEALVSNEATETIGLAFNTLSHTILAQNARTLEDLVKDLLRPMLKVWLDDNLPPLVERLVRSEIERVARGHR